MYFKHLAHIRSPWRTVVAFLAAALFATSAASVSAAGDSSGPIVTAQAQTAEIGVMLRQLQPGRSLWHKAEVYSFCGACTDDSACGTGNKCCTGNCTNGQMKCYAVSTCADAK